MWIYCVHLLPCCWVVPAPGFSYYPFSQDTEMIRLLLMHVHPTSCCQQERWFPLSQLVKASFSTWKLVFCLLLIKEFRILSMKIKMCAVLTPAPPCLMCWRLCATDEHSVQSVLQLVSEENTGLEMTMVRKKGFSTLNFSRIFSLTKNHSPPS